MSSTSPPPSSSRTNRQTASSAHRHRTRFTPQGVSRPMRHDHHRCDSQLLKLNQLVDTLKSLKRLISHYFDQISKQGESLLAGDVRRVYRRILLLYVKYRRRQNYEKRRLRQPIDKSDDDDEPAGDEDEASAGIKHPSEGSMPTWTMKKIVSSKSLPFTRAGFDAEHDGVEDFDEIALAATRDVANVQNHCIRSILADHQMTLPVYGLQTRWDSEIPKQHKQMPSATPPSVHNPRVEVIRKTGVKPTHGPPIVAPTPTARDQELFLGSLARQLNEQTWQQLRSILATCNSQPPPPNS